jgi:hypothetical protein
MSKMSFKEYLKEIFRPQYGLGEHGLDHPDLVRPHQDRWTNLLKKPDDAQTVEYHYTPKDRTGVPIHDKAIRTSFVKHGENRWDVMFTVGGRTSSLGHQDFPSDVTKRVFDHISHFVKVHSLVAKATPIITYDTTHPKKHRIYQAAAKRLGIEAQNSTDYLDPEYDRSSRPSSRRTHSDEPWIDPPHRGVHQRP